MRVAMQWRGVSVAGIALASACSSDQKSTGSPAETAGTDSSNSAGAAGTNPSGAAGAGGASSGAAGAAGTDDLAGAGAGGADSCSGNYECPSVGYLSHATITVDLPVSAATAADAVFTACRNAECHSAKGSAKVRSASPEEGWASTDENQTIWLSFDDSGPTPFAVLKWNFTYGGPTPPDDASDQYSLTVQPPGAAAASTLFDERVQYAIEVVDQNGPFEHDCSHCYEVSAATVDARAEH